MPASNYRTVEQVSAGGAVFREIDGRDELVIVRIIPSGRWQLPKGLVDEGETNEQAAVREVREEGGVTGELIAPAGKVVLWYYGDRDGERVRFHKQVHFYLLRYVSGSVEDHDHEVAEARWVTPETAGAMLTFRNEKEIVEKAHKLWKEISG